MLGCLLYSLPLGAKEEQLKEEGRLANEYLVGYGKFLYATEETIVVLRNNEQEFWDFPYVILTESVEDAEKIYKEYTSNPNNFDLRS